MRRGIVNSVVLLAVVAGCGGATPSAVPNSSLGASRASAAPAPAATATPASTVPVISPRPTTDATPAPTGTARSWVSDIELLVPQMDKLHPQLDHGVTLDELNAAANQLAADAPTLTEDQLLDGLMRVVAMVSREGCDAHTGAYVWGSNYPVDSLPLRLWLFDDGVYVVDALDPYTALIGSRVDMISGVPIGDVIAAVEPLIPRDNEWTVRLLTPRYLLIPQVLAGLGIPAAGTVGVSTLDPSGAGATNAIAPIPMREYNDWAGPYGLHLPADTGVLYLSRMDEPLWWQDLGDGTLFVQYNEVTFVSHLVGDLRDAITAPGIKRVVLDVRHNTGGEVRALDDIVHLFEEADVALLDGPYVITARNSFSAAGLLVARLQAGAGATIVGEPMGACPNAWGNSRDFKLPFSGLSVSVSTTFNVGATEDDDRSTIEPDIAAPLTEADWSAGHDPALEAIAALAE